MKLNKLLSGLTALCCLASLPSLGQDKFFANEQIQQQAPKAFALQPENNVWLSATWQLTLEHADELLAKIAQDKQLTAAIANWPELTIDEQIPWLKRVFELEVVTFGTKAPQLIIDNHSYPNKMVYFDFDNNQPSSGIVYLNPEKLAKEDKYASLAFLLHETRHSYQFQQAHQLQDVTSLGFKAAFAAQKQIQGMGFSDFLTLVNEYEAFQFGNYVLGKLTHWQVDMVNMGTFASQFNQQGDLKINLIELAKDTSKSSLLEQYNELAKQQYLLMKK